MRREGATTKLGFAVCLLLAMTVGGCKTVQYTQPPPALSVPVATDSSDVPTLSQVRYRPLGKVPYRGEYTKDGERSQFEGNVTIVATDRGTLRVRAYVERLVIASGKFRSLDLSVSNGLLADYEIDTQGYPRRIYETPGNADVTGSGGIDKEVTALTREHLFQRSTFERVINVINNPVYSETLKIGSSVFAETREAFVRRLAIGFRAAEAFVTDEFLKRLLTEPLTPATVAKIGEYNSSEKIVGAAYADGYEFLSSKGTIEARFGDTRATNNVSLLIDPYSGFPYVSRFDLVQTVAGKQIASSATIVFDLPKRFDRVMRASPAPSKPRSAPDTAAKAPAAPPVVAPPAVRPTAPGEVGTISDLYKSAVPAVTTVLAGKKLGSGFFISRDLVVTNAHVVDGANGVEVELHSGRRVPARVVERGSGDLDLAVLQLAAAVDVRPLKIARDLPEPGTPVVVIGSPLGLRGTITAGIVGAIRPTARGVLVQVDAAINHGNSGGPVLNRAGEVVGVATSYLDKAQGLGFAVFAGHIRASTGPGPFLVSF